MSHFTVAVFTDGTKSCDELLAPYNENLEVAPYIERTKKEMIDDAKIKKQYLLDRKEQEDKEDKVERYIKTNSVKYLCVGRDCEKYLKAKTDEDFYNCEYCEDELYDEKGNRLTTYNPNSKWDWYSVGGRWSGLLTLKNGRHANSALVSEIDFSRDEETYREALRWWEVIVEGSPLKNGEKKEDFFNLYKIEYLKERYQNKERYAEEMSGFSTFAVITPDGKWHEEGRMGWWACVSNENAEWGEIYKKNFIDTANPEWELTIVDCHI